MAALLCCAMVQANLLVAAIVHDIVHALYTGLSIDRNASASLLCDRSHGDGIWNRYLLEFDRCIVGNWLKRRALQMIRKTLV